jgi:hypothetical protein
MWRKNKTKDISPASNPLQDRLAIRIARAVIKIQTLFSLFLSKRTANLSARHLKLIVIFFSTCWFAVSIYFIETAFVNDNPYTTVHISHLKTPFLVNGRLREKLNTAIIITDEEYKEMQQFRKYMDSLQQCSKQNYDSILSGRPGLMDSVTLLEQIYNQQKK